MVISCWTSTKGSRSTDRLAIALKKFRDRLSRKVRFIIQKHHVYGWLVLMLRRAPQALALAIHEHGLILSGEAERLDFLLDWPLCLLEVDALGVG